MLGEGGDHTAQALQGLTFGGSSEGIGIGLGMGMLQAAHTHGAHPAHAAYQFKQVGRASCSSTASRQQHRDALTGP